MAKLKDSAGYKAFMSQPPLLRGIEILGSMVVLYFVGKGVWKMVKGGIEKGKASAAIKNVGAEKAKLEDTGVRKTFQPSQYKGWADSIAKQFSGCDLSIIVPILPGLDLSSSGSVLYNILTQFKNDLDFLELVQAFGVRTYDACGLWTGDVENATIYSAVTDELDGDEISIINEMLAGKGITYKF